MKKSSWGLVFAFLFAGILSGCASMLGNGETVKLSTNPADSTVIVYDSKGTVVETVITQSEISFNKAGNYTIEINRTDYTMERISVKRKFNHSFWLNFLVTGIGASSALIFDPNFEFQRNNYLAYAGYGVGIIGIVGIFYDIFTGSLVGITPEKINVNLRLTPEAMARQEAEKLERMARQESQRLAEAEERQRIEDERRRAAEAANRYDPAKFTVVPSNFRPADYTSVDLFRAASSARNLQIASNREEAISNQIQSTFMFGMGGSWFLEYVSDLTFVRQNGTGITFSSDDNAITQSMGIDQRSGLQAGQRVRVYYTIMRSPLTRWDVIAIERR
jgi:hypothetical protein